MKTVAQRARPRATTTAYAGCLLSAALLLSACGAAEDTASSNPSGSTGPTSAEPSTTPTASPSGSASASMPDSGRARPMTMTGKVTAVEGPCTVFKSDRDGKVFVLIGETKGATAGTAYTASGVTIDTMDPRCSQGLPFQVTSLTPGTDGAAMELTGTLESGVEAGCRVLRTNAGTYVLTGTVQPGDGTRVTVRGTRSDNVASHCQQGEVIDVQSVTVVK